MNSREECLKSAGLPKWYDDPEQLMVPAVVLDEDKIAKYKKCRAVKEEKPKKEERNRKFFGLLLTGLTVAIIIKILK